MKTLVCRFTKLVWRPQNLLWLTLLLLFGLGYAAGTSTSVFVDGADLDTILNQVTEDITRQLQAGTSLVDLLTSPVILASIIGVLAGYANYYLTLTVKSYTRLKGVGTKILAMFFSAVLGGGLGYLGLLEGADATGATGAWAGLSLLIAWTIGETKHEAKELKRTGLRKVDRVQLSKEAKKGLLDVTLDGLIAIGSPLGFSAAAIRVMYEMLGRAKLEQILGGTRAFNEQETKENQDAWERGNGSAPTS